jgi:hypothetical protein
MHRPEQFHILSFEGPDPYARAGGIATRITGLARALAGAGHETHLWFVGDPLEFVSLFSRIHTDPERNSELRLSGKRTAREYAWPRVVERALPPRI